MKRKSSSSKREDSTRREDIEEGLYELMMSEPFPWKSVILTLTRYSISVKTVGS